MDGRDPFKMGWVASKSVHIHHTWMVPDGRTGTLMAFYRPMVQQDQPLGGSPPCKCKVFYVGDEDNLLRVSQTGRKDVAHFISYELLWTYFFLYFETGAGEKGVLRATHSFNYAIYNKKYPSVDWDTWKAGWKIFMHAIDLDSNS